MAQYVLDLVYSLTNCMCCFPGSPRLSINNRSFKILRLLGEGGFSYVYLVQDNAGQLYALKKIRCPFGAESVARAMSEVEAYKLFQNHPNIISMVDFVVSTDSSRSAVSGFSVDNDTQKTVYILLPYFRRGNLQDAINANLVNHTTFPEKQLLRLFLGVCKGVQALHEHRLKSPGPVRRGPGAGQGGAEDDTEDHPLMNNTTIAASTEGVSEGELRPYAHRDIKPGNVMIADDGTTPILMDFGSLTPAPTKITSRAHALQVQDHAAETSTMPYRAPELFDVQTNSTIDAKVDIWSLGATLFCALYGHSPFELATEESGGSLALAICSGSFSFPEPGKLGGRKVGHEDVSEDVKNIVRMCLKVEPSERPDIRGLIQEVERVLATLGGRAPSEAFAIEEEDE
ncbi:kinase-like domain-containing protein [Kalaharituber pfeilii]|nr:kinase-like domain-containing protein [Kalaharituber pfeilii]